jgi:hypothetical protein
MFARISTIFLYFFIAFAGVVAAMPNQARNPATTTVTATPPTATTISQCNTGGAQCCNSVQQANSGPATALLGLLGIVLGNTDILVGITCTPITVVGGGGVNCNEQPVCCSNNNFNGAIALGCTPININV